MFGILAVNTNRHWKQDCCVVETVQLEGLRVQGRYCKLGGPPPHPVVLTRLYQDLNIILIVPPKPPGLGSISYMVHVRVGVRFLKNLRLCGAVGNPKP